MPSKDVMRRQEKIKREKLIAARRTQKRPAAKPRPFPRCAEGHEMARSWKPSHGCWKCDLADRVAEDEKLTRPVWPGGRPPVTMRVAIVSTGEVKRHTIPAHLLAQARAQRKAGRGPGRRRRL